MRIEVLYPELSRLFGDAMNVRVLETALPEAEIIRTSVKQCPAFVAGVDMIYIGSMTERCQELAASALTPYKAALAERIAGGTVILATGNACELFGEYIEDEDGTRTPMLGMYSYHVKRKMMDRFNSIYLGKFGDIDIVGFKSQFGHIYGCTEPALFETVRGAGRFPIGVPDGSPSRQPEGLHIHNFMATYLLGPLLVMNPIFAKHILSLLGFADRALPFESDAMAAYEQRLREFKDTKTKLGY